MSLAALRALGATVHVGHDAANVGEVDTVVVSTAIRETNPELVEARRRGLRVLHRAGALASVMVGRRAVAVAGTHGKTTTTSLLTVAIQHCGADPSFAIGGNLNESGANAHNGSGDVFVAEADESDGSFLLYSPTAAVVTNVEPDHLDHYGTAEAVEEAFDAFARRVEPGGFLVACADDPGAVRLAASAREARHRRPHLRRGPRRRPAAGRPGDPRPRQLVRGGAAAAGGSAGSSCGCPAGTTRSTPPPRWRSASGSASRVERLREGLASFTGTRRRFEHKGTVGGVRVFDSYAHHPTELTADLVAAREVVDGGRVVVVFQPHLFSRTQAFAAEFGTALGLADEVVVMDVYAAREDPVPGVTGALVAAAVPLPAGAGRVRAVLVGGGRPPGRAGPARRRRAHLRRRRRDDDRPRGARPAGGRPVVSVTDRARAAGSPPRGRARRRTRLTITLTVTALLGLLGLAGWLLLGTSRARRRATVQVTGTAAAGPGRGRASWPASRPARRWPGSTPARSPTGCAGCPPCAPSTVQRQLAAHGARSW